jgi:hypothetical protein
MSAGSILGEVDPMTSTTTEWALQRCPKPVSHRTLRNALMSLAKLGFCQTCMALWPPATDAFSSSAI